jgi:hypothetical protein
MLLADQLQQVANSIVRRAQRQGYVVPRDIREELGQVGLPEARWKEVVNLARESLNCRQGRYYHLTSFSPRLQQEQQQQQQIQRAIRRLIRHYKASSANHERRQQDRIDFIQPVKVEAEDGREFTLLSRDLSTTGIRLIGTRRLLGQKVRIQLPLEDTSCSLLVRILWTCAVGDDMFENGGTFVAVLGE